MAVHIMICSDGITLDIGVKALTTRAAVLAIHQRIINSALHQSEGARDSINISDISQCVGPSAIYIFIPRRYKQTP